MRVAVGAPLRMADFPAPGFAAVDVQWFAGLDGALANDAWLRAAAPGGLGVGDDGIGPGSWRVVAEEVVLRGEAHLRARWAAGGERYKMMSFGRRNPALSAAAFSERWRGHAGSLGGSSIPEDVRGSAYVQNHPVPLDGCEWPLDAVNEAYLDDLDGLRRQ